ncbi:hypothetical protein Syun_000522 [Stephania yunnanensis]|uniref:Transmembrane protein n=1 Tax=Stephania yunnanensis TaxID=152371 RepID=A0AAP0Q5E7_9MAGN
MSASALTSSLPPLNLISITTKPRNSLSLSFPSLDRTQNPTLSSSHSNGSRRINEIHRVSATTETGLPSEPPLETAQQIITSDEGGAASNVISILLLVAFVGLTILTIGVVYIGVSDFLEKREREKFEKEESEKKSKVKGKKGVVRAKNGPRGFGQKIDEDDDF